MTEGFKTSAGGDVWGTSDPWNKPKAPNLYHAPCIQTTEYLIFTLRFSGSGPHLLAVWDKFVTVEGALASSDWENSGRTIP